MRIDRTEYAKQLGYQGKKRVIIQDGRVISHNGVEWHVFCASVTEYSKKDPTLPKTA